MLQQKKELFAIWTKSSHNKIFLNKTGYYLEILTPEPMKLLESATSKTTKHFSWFRITKEVLVHCNIVNNGYQYDSRFWYTFVPNESLGQFLDLPPKNLISLKISEFSYIEIWLTGHNFKPPEIEDKISTTLVIN